jgi:membrane protease subunit HflC
MKKTIGLTISGVIAVIILFLVFSSMYIIDLTQQAVILRFGQIREIKTEPGLYFKTPFLENVVKLEKRIMLYDISAERIITSDKKTIIVDTVAIWKIEDPRIFIESLRTTQMALSRIDDIVYSNIRDALAKYTFLEIISDKRPLILDEVVTKSRVTLKNYGVYLEDVRIKRSDLPDQNTQAVYNRMKAERQSIAAQIRSEGEREAQIIRAEADKQVTILLSEARKDAEIMKGAADAKAIELYAEAYGMNDEFYELLRITQMYETSFKDSILTIPSDSPLLKFFQEVK